MDPACSVDLSPPGRHVRHGPGARLRLGCGRRRRGPRDRQPDRGGRVCDAGHPVGQHPHTHSHDRRTDRGTPGDQPHPRCPAQNTGRNIMSGIAELHAQALDVTGRIVAGIPPGRWHAGTPCKDWDARALLGHVVSGNLWAAELAAGATIESVGDRLNGDVLGADPVRSYAASAEAAAAAFLRRGALEAPCAVSYGPVPGSVYAGHRFVDVFIHGWDLATATGQPSPVTPELAAACWQVGEPQLDLLRGSGMYGSEQAVPADADVTSRLLLTV